MTETYVVNIKHNPNYDVFIGRPSVWGNPYRIGPNGTREEVIELYRKRLLRCKALLLKCKTELRGKVLGCYCKPLPCHGDVLAEIANED